MKMSATIFKSSAIIWNRNIYPRVHVFNPLSILQFLENVGHRGCAFNDISQYGQGKGNTGKGMNVTMTLWAFIQEKNVQRGF